MDVKELFDKYYSRLAREGMIKALFCGLIVGFGVNFVVAFTAWYYGWNGLWWALGAWGLVTAIATPIFYAKKFKPSAKAVAERLDRLGLEERMITMTEFIGEESYIMQKQRQDAQLTMNKLEPKRIRFKFPKSIIIVLAVSFLMSGGMTTVSGLSNEGILKPGKEVFEEILPEPDVEYVTITYVVASGEGVIEGDDIQIVEKGSSTIEIIAVADDGYAFVEWSDGIKDPHRYELAVEEDMIIEATFAQIGEGEGEGEGEGGGEGQAGEGDEPGKSDKPSDEEGEPNNGANGAYEENNMIKDGNTYYRDLLESGGYYEEAMKWLESAENIPDELRDFIQTYFEVIV